MHLSQLHLPNHVDSVLMLDIHILRQPQHVREEVQDALDLRKIVNFS